MAHASSSPIAAPKPLLSVAEAAQVAGYSRATFYRLVRAAPEGSALRRALVAIPGAQLRIRRRQLEAWLTGEGAVPAA
jgi:hypothetical protein